MKKFFAYFAAIIFAATTAWAVVPATETFSNNGYTGPWNPDDQVSKGVTNDYSFDYATGEYKVFVICEIDVCNISNNIYLGWLNPDGAKDLNGTEFNMDFKVTGGNGWPFEASASFGGAGSTNSTAFAISEQTNAPVTTVFITGSSWWYDNGNGPVQVGSGQTFSAVKNYLSGYAGVFGNGIGQSGLQPGSTYGPDDCPNCPEPQYENNQTIKNFWNVGACGQCTSYPRLYSNACQGEGQFRLNPGTIWAAPNATEGFYTFPVYVEVDYLTFKNAPNFYSFNGGGQANDPGSYQTQP